MKILLFGDERGLPVLTQKIPKENIAGLVCASIRPACIGMIRDMAAQLEVPFLVQPKPADAEYPLFVNKIQEINPGLIWVYSYSMILRDDVLAIPAKGAINIHGALLPQYRGANPTQWAILNGETETGVTLHLMTSGVDEGPIIDQQKIPLFFEDTWKDVFERNDQAAHLLIENNLASILQGSWKANAQDEALAGFCRRRTQADGLFSWEQPVYQIYNLVRALVKPIPGAFYIDKDNKQVTVDEYLTIQQVIQRKYSVETGHQLIGGPVQLLVRNEDVAEEGFATQSTATSATEISFWVKQVSDGAVVGLCRLKRIDWRNRNAEMEISLNTGIGALYAAVVDALCGFGFSELNLNRIYVHLPVANSDAARICKEKGFEEEGILREGQYANRQWVDLRVMGRLNKKERG